MNPILRRALLGGALMAGLEACTTPTLVCGCSPAPPRMAAEGTATTAAGDPVEGASVYARVMNGACEEASASAVPGPAVRPSTAVDGFYRLDFFVTGAGPHCVRIVATRAPGDSVASGNVVFQASDAGEPPVARRVDLIFP